MKFKYLYTGKKKTLVDINGKSCVLHQIEAKCDFVNKATGKKIFAGDKGGYVPFGALSQAGTAWVDEGSYVISKRYVSRISEDAYIANSRVSGRVCVSGNSLILTSVVCCGRDAALNVDNNAIISNSVINASGVIAGDTSIRECKLHGKLALYKNKLTNIEVGPDSTFV